MRCPEVLRRAVPSEPRPPAVAGVFRVRSRWFPPYKTRQLAQGCCAWGAHRASSRLCGPRLRGPHAGAEGDVTQRRSNASAPHLRVVKNHRWRRLKSVLLLSAEARAQGGSPKSLWIQETMDPGNVDIGKYSENMPIDTSMSSFRQFEPLCKFHQTEAFNNELVTFQNLPEGLPYTEEPEFQCHVCNYAEDTYIQEDSFKEENSMGTSTSTNKDQLVLECVRQPRSPPLIHCNGETLEFMEMSLANSSAMESACDAGQPHSFLCEENEHSDFEQPSYEENSVNLLDVRANYETEEIAGSSKGMENSTDIPEMSVRQQKEVAVEVRECPEIVSVRSPGGMSWSGEASWENCMMSNTEQSLESSPPLEEEDMALNEALRKLRRTNREQHALIQDLRRSNVYLEKKVEELQMKAANQQVSVDIINKLKEDVEKLIEDKYRVMLERIDTEKTLQNLHEILANTQKHLQESRIEKETLQLELKKTKGSYVSLQERYLTEIQQKNEAAHQCIAMDRALSQKEEEVERLQLLKGDLEKAIISALGLLKREKENREQEFLSLQEEFQKHEKANLDERQKLKSELDKVVAQVQNLQFISDSEKAKNTKLQQQINEVKNENAKLQQQVARSTEQSYDPNIEVAQLTEHLEEIIESDMAKDAKMVHSDLFWNHSPCEEESQNPPDGKRASQLTSKICNLLALMIGLLTCQDLTKPDAEHFKESEEVSDIMLQKLKSFHLKKNLLDKELLKHKERITTFRELIANEKSFQDQVTEVTDVDSSEAKDVGDVPVSLGAKLDQYHSLNKELDFLVTSYEEIIKCADQRLVIFHSQIAHLEERNKHLEDLIRRPRERARKPRPRSHLKSMTVEGAWVSVSRSPGSTDAAAPDCVSNLRAGFAGVRTPEPDL
ncbi:cancer-associated gene 1 protein isoform X6 [Sus scrofa]|uniref:cancer-associated gene 1 protein isoform X6 n=1 Tax=Sus scrofa TaxID=9823 RepID=UPI000A2B4AA0|nr:cancer-associated gene 1 protein isoform X6 [Sus scrofa]